MKRRREKRRRVERRREKRRNINVWKSTHMSWRADEGVVV